MMHKKKLFSLATNEAKMDLDQCIINPLNTGCKYTNNTGVSESIDLSVPSGGSDKRTKRKVYGMARLNGSS